MTSSCWMWKAARSPRGYGVASENGKTAWAHRKVYHLLVGEIPPGLTIDHLCRNPGCVNPAHLEVVTGKENTLRGVSGPAKNAQKTKCPSGHPYNTVNTYRSKRGRRHCRECMKLKCRAQRARATAIRTGRTV